MRNSLRTFPKNGIKTLHLTECLNLIRLISPYFGESVDLWETYSMCSGPVKTSFWKNVFSRIATITSIFISPEPGMALLNLGIKHFPPYFRTGVIHVLLAVRSLIMRYWKTNRVPNVSEALEIIQMHYTFKFLLANKHGARKSFYLHWKVWTDCFKDWNSLTT